MPNAALSRDGGEDALTWSASVRYADQICRSGMQRRKKEKEEKVHTFFAFLSSIAFRLAAVCCGAVRHHKLRILVEVAMQTLREANSCSLTMGFAMNMRCTAVSRSITVTTCQPRNTNLPVKVNVRVNIDLDSRMCSEENVLSVRHRADRPCPKRCRQSWRRR